MRADEEGERQREKRGEREGAAAVLSLPATVTAVTPPPSRNERKERDAARKSKC